MDNELKRLPNLHLEDTTWEKYTNTSLTFKVILQQAEMLRPPFWYQCGHKQ